MRSALTDVERLRALVETIDAFYIRDRALMRAQKKMADLLAQRAPDAAATRAYLAEVKRYFAGFDREAEAQLARVDRELANLYTRQYNLTAERAVAARRVEATQGVLAKLAELAAR